MTLVPIPLGENANQVFIAQKDLVHLYHAWEDTFVIDHIWKMYQDPVIVDTTAVNKLPHLLL